MIQYHNFSKFRDTVKFVVLQESDRNRNPNSEDPDQTAPGSAMFTET